MRREEPWRKASPTLPELFAPPDLGLDLSVFGSQKSGVEA